MMCPRCEKFFAQFRCSAATHGECDCPRCQGYCEGAVGWKWNKQGRMEEVLCQEAK
jgi:hypothetical protein